MFTGLVQELGKVSRITHGETSAVITINTPISAPQISRGDSISVNGVCLTAISVSGDSFTADVMKQTLKIGRAHV